MNRDAAVPADAPDEQDDAAGGERAWAAKLTRSGAWGVLAERWVPEPLREARIDPGRRGAVLLCTVAALAALIAAVGVWLSRPTPTPVAASAGIDAQADMDAAGDPLASAGSAGSTGSDDSAESPGPLGAVDGSGDGQAVEAVSGVNGAGSAGPGGASAAPPSVADDVPAGPILVSVTGEVRRPSVVSVPADARVADAIEAAGGVADLSLLAGMNLAAHLTDGASIVVGGPGGNAVVAESVDESVADSADVAPGSPAAAGSSLVNINTADSAALQQLSGVGPVTAEAIITYRTQHGPFTELSQLQEVSGIGPATYARLAPHVTL